MIHLRSIGLKRKPASEEFPFSVPVIQTLSTIDFPTPVTFFVGENGSGKSTLLEGVACAVGLPTVGSESVATDPTLAHVQTLANHLSQTWTKRSHRGFFLRAEDFFGFAKRMSQARVDARRAMQAIDEEYKDRSELAKGLAKMPHARTVGELQQLYGEGLDTQSHGESFLKLFQSRLAPNGLYLLDEPEAPLSPLRQLAFIAQLKEMIGVGCQFIIATHSPIILAFPGATILSCDSTPIEAVAYEDLEHVTLTRSFLNSPEQFLARL